eukprot:Tamp_11351.p1 GENE.Tamp_11351~~Tamp_11351.p1  ORF type:complete len:429 (+),score=51.08 Tamp_11351:174-1460(+)
MKSKKWFWPWGQAKVKKFEDELLAAVPPSWAGPLMVMHVSFFAFACLWFVIAKRPTSRRILHKYKLQTALEDRYSQFDPKSGSSHRFFKAELATRVASSVHASVCCYGALVCLLGENSLAEDKLWNALPRTTFYFSISIAYFIGDLLICSIQFREYGVLFVLHAIASLIGLSIMCFGNMFHFFGCIGMLWEFTTIMINNRWLLLEYGYKNTLFYHLNGLVLVLVFFAVRVVVGCWYSYMFWNSLSEAHTEGQVGRGLYLLVTIVLAGFNSLNIYWCYKLTSRSLVVVRRWVSSLSPAHFCIPHCPLAPPPSTHTHTHTHTCAASQHISARMRVATDACLCLGFCYVCARGGVMYIPLLSESSCGRLRRVKERWSRIRGSARKRTGSERGNGNGNGNGSESGNESESESESARARASGIKIERLVQARW